MERDRTENDSERWEKKMEGLVGKTLMGEQQGKGKTDRDEGPVRAKWKRDGIQEDEEDPGNDSLVT